MEWSGKGVGCTRAGSLEKGRLGRLVGVGAATGDTQPRPRALCPELIHQSSGRAFAVGAGGRGNRVWSFPLHISIMEKNKKKHPDVQRP